MTDSERRTAAARFAADWKGRGDEKQFRLSSTKAATQRSADTPTLFQEIRHPDSEYIIVPRHSSEARRYIPFGFVVHQNIVDLLRN